jgi:hypothetical protein
MSSSNQEYRKDTPRPSTSDHPRGGRNTVWRAAGKRFG